MKLIPMTAFVQQQLKGKVLYQHLEKVVNYSDFLIQKLKIWMFVPCKLVDGVWVVLKEPVDYENWITKNIHDPHWMISLECSEYQEAKERCLFTSCPYNLATMEKFMNDKRTIEFFDDLDLELTPAALKQIGF